MKKANLIYNHNSGKYKDISLEKITRLLYKIGIEAVYQRTESEDDLDIILSNPYDLVICAGGDGTTRSVVKRIIDKDAVLAVIPIGTANNFTYSLSVSDDYREVIKSLPDAKPAKVDIGKVSAPWGDEIFIEGVGFGLFADLLTEYRPVTDKKVTRVLKVLIDGLNEVRTYDNQLEIDDVDYTDRYLMVEILNTASIGPRLQLAAGSDMNDGFLNSVLIGESENLFDLGFNLFTGKVEDIKGHRLIKSKEIKFKWNGFPIHIDDQVYPDINKKMNYWYTREDKGFPNDDSNSANYSIQVKILEKELKMLLSEND